MPEFTKCQCLYMWRAPRLTLLLSTQHIIRGSSHPATCVPCMVSLIWFTFANKQRKPFEACRLLHCGRKSPGDERGLSSRIGNEPERRDDLCEARYCGIHSGGIVMRAAQCLKDTSYSDGPGKRAPLHALWSNKTLGTKLLQRERRRVTAPLISLWSTRGNQGFLQVALMQHRRGQCKGINETDNINDPRKAIIRCCWMHFLWYTNCNASQ